MESLPRSHAWRGVGVKGGLPHECDVSLPRFAPVEAANDNHMARLARAIEYEIIPRLMLAHRGGCEAACSPGESPSISPSEVEQFAKLVLSHDEDMALAAIDGLRTREVSVEDIYISLLAPTARYLGDMWSEDLCSFTDVTVGLGRLQRVLRELSPALGRSIEHPVNGRRILLLPSPGEQHTFGLVMVAEFFRRAGWDVSGGAGATGVDAVTLVAAEWFDVVGFSTGAEVHIPTLASTIAAVRHVACNAGLAVIVGGPLLSANPQLVATLGADGMTMDGREAPSMAEQLISVEMGLRMKRG